MTAGVRWGRRSGGSLVALVCAAGLANDAAHGDTILVPQHHLTIQAAIDAAHDGDRVLVGSGLYLEALDLGGKAITVKAVGGTSSTTIDGSGQTTSVLTCMSGENEDTVIEGFTIARGDAGLGGGMTIVSASPTVRDCVFLNNSSDEHGGGVHAISSGARFINCSFVANEASIFGGGVYDISGSGQYVNCVFMQNESAGGGGLNVLLGEPRITGCTFTDNVADFGAGIRASSNGAPVTITVRNSIVWGNDGDVEMTAIAGATIEASYSNVGGGWPGQGNIDADPQAFVADVTSLWLAAGSPCIDAASNDAVPADIDEDRDGLPRFVDDPGAADTGLGPAPVVDMGASERQVTDCPADIDGSGQIGLGDLLVILATWQCAGCPADIDGSGHVGLGDLLLSPRDVGIMLMRRSVPALFAALGAVMPAVAGEVAPTDGMVILENTVFARGTYTLPNGVSIGASGVTLDLNGAVLVGVDFDNYGVTSVGHDDVVIKNGVMRGYYYGIRVEQGSNVQILNNTSSENWVDPESLGPSAPFLNINIGPLLGDRTNLGGGLFLNDLTFAAVDGNVLTDQENGMDLYAVRDSSITNNVASDNTGWGVHLNACKRNTLAGNTADRCTHGLGDSAGFLLVNGSHENVIENNSFTHSGDGFFIGNEHGCPSNDNLVRGNDGSFAGANAFEATFSSGNHFIGNIADGSNYGFWLGYSHSGNEIVDNRIRANNVNGIEIEHGQANVIRGNLITGNGGRGIVLRTDGVAHFPPASFPCLALPDQASSRDYAVHDNVITNNFGRGLDLTNTTDSMITNNLVAGNVGGSTSSNGGGNTWASAPRMGRNIVGGPFLGGNYWGNYGGADLDEDGLGDTEVPYTNGGLIAAPGDPHPLIGDPKIETFENPQTLCARRWRNLGRNTRTTGGVFDTANGTHFATDGDELYLLEGSNGTRLSRFDPVETRYEPRADVPEAVWDGGGFQHAGATYFATVGVQFDPADGSGKGARLYAYDAASNTWSSRAASTADGDLVANEALAYDPVNDRLYATIVEVTDGAVATLTQRLAIYDPKLDTWVGTTAKNTVAFGPGSEIEHLGGRIYAWPGLFEGGGVSGGDSFLYVYEIATDTWSTTPTLQSSGVIPGFRSGAFDIWGVTLTSDAASDRLFVLGGEANRQVYVFTPGDEAWHTIEPAVYDGGWGDGLEYVAATSSLYQIDGRTALGNPQGTAVFTGTLGDVDDDGAVGFVDLLAVLAAWGPCADTCCPADLDETGVVGFSDLLLLLASWGVL